MTVLHDQDRELQIRLAELQTDVQMYSNALFSFLAIFIAIAIGISQVIYSLPFDQLTLRFVLIVFEVFCIVGAIASARIYIEKIRVARGEMGKLRKKYVW